MTTFKESRMAQIVNALREAGAEQAEQVDRITPKTDAQLEADRSAAAIVLSAALLRQREARFGGGSAKSYRARQSCGYTIQCPGTRQSNGGPGIRFRSRTYQPKRFERP